MTRLSLPPQGRDWKVIGLEMEAAHAADLPVHNERLFGPAYFADERVLEVGRSAFAMYYSENALYGATSYPSILRYETEIVEFLLDLLHAPGGAAGNLTIGGTESNMMAVKMARDQARASCLKIKKPEIVVPRTAHPSFFKAGQMLGLKVVRMAKSVDYRADLEAMARAVTPNTIMLVASAPPYPYGVVDPVAEIAELASDNGLWMHVDCCLGGLILPFACQFDSSIPDFDFRVPGVTSISTDLHKYGYAVKGISSLMVRDEALQIHRRFVFDDPVAGFYSTPNIAGTRPAGAIASAWAVMNFLGWEGYSETVRALLEIKRRLIEGIRRVDGLEICGEPHAAHFNYTSSSLDMYAVASGLEERGWKAGLGGEPPSIWMMVNMTHRDIVDDYLQDLGEIVQLVKAGKIKGQGREAIYAR